MLLFRIPNWEGFKLYMWVTKRPEHSSTETTESEILVNQIYYLLPPFQNRGIGGEIISNLQEKSREPQTFR